MTVWLPLIAKILVAGVFVALLAHLSSALKPKMFAGLLSGAPSVATVSLLLTSLQKPAAVHAGGRGMILGAAGLVACCAVASLLVPKLHAIVATAVGWGSWAVLAFGLFLVVPK
ncbi:MAG TPA: hypothetical protein VF160_01630 [Candidatus Dormibacteraeota bacterium]